MNLFHTCLSFIVLLQVFTKNVLSENATHPNIADDSKSIDPNSRRSAGILILDNAGKTSDGQRVTSHKVETKTYTTHVSSIGNSGSGGIQGWVSESQNQGNVIVQPQIQGIVQTQQACGQANNVLSNTGDQASIIQKKSTLASSQAFNGGSSINSITSDQNQWQMGQNGIKVGPLVVGQLTGQPSILQGSLSRVTTNNLNDVTGTIISGSNHGLNALYEGANNIQRQENLFYPDNDSYKVSVTTSGDGIYANELTGQQKQNLNMMVTESNSPNIVAVPVMRPQLGRFIVQGYRPNMQYYLRQIEANNLIKNPSAILRVPSFMERIKPDQGYINLSEDQLNSYKQYLIQSGLIKLKPYQLIFSDQFRPKLKTLQWTVVPFESNSEYCKQRCGNLFARNTLYSTITENASKLPLKLLVPVLKIRTGFQKTATGVQNIAGGVGDISGGVYRIMKDSPSHVAGLLKEKSVENKDQQ